MTNLKKGDEFLVARAGYTYKTTIDDIEDFIGPGGGGAQVIISDTAPDVSNLDEGTLWWDSKEGDLFVLYDDPNTPDLIWVDASNHDRDYDNTVIISDQEPTSGDMLGQIWVNTGECPYTLNVWSDCGGTPEWVPIGGGGSGGGPIGTLNQPSIVNIQDDTDFQGGVKFTKTDEIIAVQGNSLYTYETSDITNVATNGSNLDLTLSSPKDLEFFDIGDPVQKYVAPPSGQTYSFSMGIYRGPLDTEGNLPTWDNKTGGADTTNGNGIYNSTSLAGAAIFAEFEQDSLPSFGSLVPGASAGYQFLAYYDGTNFILDAKSDGALGEAMSGATLDAVTPASRWVALRTNANTYATFDPGNVINGCVITDEYPLSFGFVRNEEELIAASVVSNDYPNSNKLTVDGGNWVATDNTNSGAAHLRQQTVKGLEAVADNILTLAGDTDLDLITGSVFMTDGSQNQDGTYSKSTYYPITTSVASIIGGPNYSDLGTTLTKNETFHGNTIKGTVQDFFDGSDATYIRNEAPNNQSQATNFLGMILSFPVAANLISTTGRFRIKSKGSQPQSVNGSIGVAKTVFTYSDNSTSTNTQKDLAHDPITGITTGFVEAGKQIKSVGFYPSNLAAPYPWFEVYYLEIDGVRLVDGTSELVFDSEQDVQYFAPGDSVTDGNNPGVGGGLVVRVASNSSIIVSGGNWRAANGDIAGTPGTNVSSAAGPVKSGEGEIKDHIGNNLSLTNSNGEWVGPTRDGSKFYVAGPQAIVDPFPTANIEIRSSQFDANPGFPGVGDGSKQYVWTLTYADGSSVERTTNSDVWVPGEKNTGGLLNLSEKHIVSVTHKDTTGQYTDSPKSVDISFTTANVRNAYALREVQINDILARLSALES